MAETSANIKEFILNHVADHPRGISALAEERFGISRSAVNRHLKRLVDDGFLEASGATRAREYRLKNFVDESFETGVIPGVTEESWYWSHHAAPHLQDLPRNVLRICEYGFTEILNNAFEHSESQNVFVSIERNAASVRFAIQDSGIGIFNKLQREFGYVDARHAAFELSKGRLTTNSKIHTGYGIFFTSRAFDVFRIFSGNLTFDRVKDEDNWIFESNKEREVEGTWVSMKIHPQAPQILQNEFDKYGHAFVKTQVSLSLLKYEGEELISRSQARRLLARLDQFEEVVLDFEGIAMIGHSFADEIFRVYQNANPKIEIITMSTTPEIEKVIESFRATADTNKQ